MTFHVLFCGKKLKSPEIHFIDEYHKRISRYASVKLIYIPEPKTKLPYTDVSPHIKKGTSLFSLDVSGKQFSTEEFAKLLSKHGSKTMSFLIGPSYGISAEVLGNSAETISLSKMTLPHRLALVVLSEQLYRCTSFLNGHPYHHQD